MKPYSLWEEELTKAGNGEPILHPTSKKTATVSVGSEMLELPRSMVAVPAGEFTFGTGLSARRVSLPTYAIGKFLVTNAEYSAFLMAYKGRRPPRYWKDGCFPEGKAAHPVAYVSLTDAKAYAAWVSKETGWDIRLPTAEQWERAARGPKETLYPWGNDAGVSYRGGALSTRFNFNAVLAAECLKKTPTREVVFNHPRSPYKGTKVILEKLIQISATGNVRGWVNHQDYTGFIYTDLFTELSEQGGNTSAVGAYKEGVSGYGCYDMAGNLWCWCDSTTTATNGAERGKRVNEIRGGSWYATGRSCQSVALGEGRQAEGAYNTVGFRLVLCLPPKTR